MSTTSQTRAWSPELQGEWEAALAQAEAGLDLLLPGGMLPTSRDELWDVVVEMHLLGFEAGLAAREAAGG